MKKYVLALMLCISLLLPAFCFAEQAETTQRSPMYDAQMQEALAMFHRFADLQKERGVENVQPLDEADALSGDLAFYMPLEGFVLKGVENTAEHDSLPAYVCGFQTAGQFDDMTGYWMLIDLLRAISPSLSAAAAEDLLNELLYYSGPPTAEMESVRLGIVYYGEWRFMYTVIVNGEEGGLFSALPADPVDELENTSFERIKRVRQRFQEHLQQMGVQAYGDGDPETYQNGELTDVVRMFAMDVVWTETLAGRRYCMITMETKETSDIGKQMEEMFVGMLYAVDPFSNEGDARAMYQEMLGEMQQNGDGMMSPMYSYGNYGFLLSATNGNVGIHIFFPGGFI